MTFKKSNDVITLVLICDNHLVVMLSALLKSIELSHKSEEIIHIYIINDGISKQNVLKINNTISSNKISLFWKTIEEAVPDNFELPVDNSTYPMCIYVRLFLSYFLPQDVERVIYLDIDMIVLKDIQYLWNTDIGNYTIGAVVDIAQTVSSPWGGIKNYKELDISPDSKYFNSGLLLVNLKKWREMDATKLILNSIHQYSKYALYPDQYGLNVVFANRWYELDTRWNSYSQGTIKDPFIIHFTEIKPIFKSYNLNNDYKKIFYSILELTPWSNFTPKSNYTRHIKRVENLISKGSWLLLVKKFFTVLFKSINPLIINKVRKDNTL